MGTDILTMEKKLLNRNKWTYSVGGIGRDMVYQLVATFFLTYVQYSGLNLTAGQFSVIGILLVIGRVWDAVNDPIMGSIVENTHSRWGKFKPWILIGAVSTAVVIIFMFNLRPAGWGFVVFFGVIYLIWEMAFTLNDIPYWSLLPALAKTKKDRDTMATMVVVFAGVGGILGNIIITLTTVGNMVKGYSMIAFSFSIFFVACTLLTVLGVKEPKEIVPENAEKVTIRKMFSVIKNNDQLLWASLALMFYSVGSGLLTALGYNFFYVSLGYDGNLITIFILTYFVGTILMQSFYSVLAKKYSRRKLMTISFIVLSLGYGLLLILGYVPFLPLNIITACIFGLLVSAGQGIFYLVVIISMTNSIEYNEYKTGNRNEAIVFSLRPFVAKFSSALQQGLVTLVLVVSGIYGLSQNVGELEKQKNLFDRMTIVEQYFYKQHIEHQTVVFDEADLDAETIALLYEVLGNTEGENPLIVYEDPDGDGIESMIINAAADNVFRDRATPTMQFMIRLSISVVPVALIFGAYWILKKKYIITEEYYDMITKKPEIQA